MVAPLLVKLIVFSVAKKVTVFLVAKLYGFPRLYRRMAKLNHYLNRNNPERRQFVTNRLQDMFRLPRHIYQAFQRLRGAPEPPQGPHSSTGPSNDVSTSAHQKQARGFHTSSRITRVSRLSIPMKPSSIRGLNFVSHSIRLHLLGWMGEKTHSVRRQFSSSSILPFGANEISGFTTPAKQERQELSAQSSGLIAGDNLRRYSSEATESVAKKHAGESCGVGLGCLGCVACYVARPDIVWKRVVENTPLAATQFESRSEIVFSIYKSSTFTQENLGLQLLSK